jgi:hypothetical protein
MSESSQGNGGLANLISRLWRDGQKGTRGRPSGDTAQAASEENSGTVAGAAQQPGQVEAGSAAHGSPATPPTNTRLP